MSDRESRQGTGYSVLEIVQAFERASGRSVPYTIAPCQAQIEMSSFSQSRNVRFMCSPPSPVFVAPVAGVGATDDLASA